MPFSMALPTTPTFTAASTASGKTQKTSMLRIDLNFRRSDQNSTSTEIYLGYMLEGKGQIQVLPVSLFTDHEDFVGGGLEGIRHRSDDLTRIVHGRQADQVSHVELSFFGRIELLAVEHELPAPQSIRVASILNAIEVEQEAFRG